MIWNIKCMLRNLLRVDLYSSTRFILVLHCIKTLLIIHKELFTNNHYYPATIFDKKRRLQWRFI